MTKTRLEGARASLAAAIEERNAAAKRAEDAEAAFAAFMDGYGKLRDALWAAEERREKVDKEMDEIRNTPTGNFSVLGNHRQAFIKHVVERKGQTPDEITEAAKKAEASAQEAVSARANEKDKLAVQCALAKEALERAKGAIEEAARRVIHQSVPFLQAEAKAASDDALRKVAALNFAAKGINLSHSEVCPGHELWDARRLLSNFIYFYDPEKKAEQDAGSMPWLSAFQRLLVDPSAPLPTDPTPLPTRKAA